MSSKTRFDAKGVFLQEDSDYHDLIIKTVKKLEQMPIYFEPEYYRNESRVPEEVLQERHEIASSKKMIIVDHVFDSILGEVNRQMDQEEDGQRLAVLSARYKETRDMREVYRQRIDGWLRVGRKYIESLKNPPKLDIIYYKDVGELYHYEEGWSPWNKGESLAKLIAIVEEIEKEVESKDKAQFYKGDNLKKDHSDIEKMAPEQSL